MNEKLKELITDKLTISINRFSKEIGVSRQTIYNILKGGKDIKINTVKKICAYFGVDYHEYI